MLEIFNKVYQRNIFNEKYIETNINPSASTVIRNVNNFFIRQNNLNKLYYEINNLSRFNGKSYLYTEYESRFYGRVQNLPIDLPSINLKSDPYGIFPDFVDNTSLNETNNIEHINIINVNNPIENELNYFKIKHSYFFRQ